VLLIAAPFYVTSQRGSFFQMFSVAGHGFKQSGQPLFVNGNVFFKRGE